jgi:hypothetical protein
MCSLIPRLGDTTGQGVAVAAACVHWLFKTQPEEAYLMCSLIPRDTTRRGSSHRLCSLALQDTTGRGVAVATSCVH